MPAFNMYLTEKQKELVKELPRSVSMSKIVKWILMSIVLPENELLKEMRKNREEVKEITEFLKSKIERLNRP